MEHLMPTANQRRIQEDIPFTEWDNPYFMLNEVDELAVAVEDKYISIHRVEDGYDYTIYHADYREFDGGVYDNPDISIHTALDEIVADLKLTEPQITGMDYEMLSEKVEQQDISDRISKQVEDNRIVDDFKAKTREHFNNISGETPDDIENTVHAYVKSKIDEYDARASIVGMAVVGSRCRRLEQEESDLDVVVEFAGSEREDDLFNLVHEDGLMIGGVMVDINPITEAKTGTLATYLPTVEQYLTEKQIQQQAEQDQAEKIAVEIDQLAYDYDTYEYKDQVEDREVHIQSIAADIRNGEADYMGDFLNALIAEETREGIGDLFGKGMTTDDSEAIQTIRKAKELLDRLTEYKPLTKVEELEEQNYNMIDNVLNNGVGEGNQIQKTERTSVKEKLVQKKSEIEQRHKANTTVVDKGTEDKNERFI